MEPRIFYPVDSIPSLALSWARRIQSTTPSRSFCTRPIFILFFHISVGFRKFSFLQVFKPNFCMDFFYLLCLPHSPPFSSWFYHRITFDQKSKSRSNKRKGESNSDGSVRRFVLTFSAPNNEYCGSRLECQACQKHIDLPSCMITSPSSITTPWLLLKRLFYTLQGTNERCKAISSHNPPLYDRWRSSVNCVSCVRSCGVLRGCDPFILRTLVLFMWWIVMGWKECQFQMLSK
jgi:hypothetical protein